MSTEGNIGMSAQVDALRPFRVAEAYCYDAGAPNAAKNLRDAVAALIAERDALREKLERLLGAAGEVADEHMGVVARTIYTHDDDEVGERVCCGVVSYKDHADDCPAVRLRTALARCKGEQA